MVWNLKKSHEYQKCDKHTGDDDQLNEVNIVCDIIGSLILTPFNNGHDFCTAPQGDNKQRICFVLVFKMHIAFHN